MLKLLRKIWDKMNEPQNEKVLIVLLPCLAILTAGCILAPRLFYLAGQAVIQDKADVPQSTEIIESAAPQSAGISTASGNTQFVPTSAPTQTSVPSPSVSESPTAKVYLSAVSTEKDLYVRIMDESGAMLTGEKFTLNFDYPSGETYSFSSETDGTCYLVRLEPGEYTVRMADKEGYVTAEPVSCTVKAQVEYVQIEHIDEYLDVVDNTAISQTEIKTGNDSGQTVTPEIIVSVPEVSGPNSTVTEEIPVLDESGDIQYSYSFDLGPGGFILLAESGLESQVIPMDENNDGIAEYGLQWVSEGPDENGIDQGYYEGVELYAADGKPLSVYSVTATPVTELVTTLMGWQEIDGNTYYYDGYGNPVVGLKSIDGKLYYFNQYGIKARSLGIDVSFYNEGINWPAVKAQGIDFAIVRVGGRGWETGLLYDDVCFQQNLNGARAAGLKVGVYFYSTAIDAVEAVQEASLVLERLNGTALDYPIFIDVEQSGDYPYGRSDQLSKTMRNEIVTAFCQTVINSGYRAGVYSGQNFFANHIDHNALSQYYIWLASYTSNNKLPGYGGHYDMWQFTDGGVVNGIKGKVDMNVIF